jgi:hypothetical protein
MYRNGLVIVLVALLAAASGCGHAAPPVKGVVTLDGKPVAGATVSLYAEGSEQPAALGASGSDGAFTAVAPDGKGPPPGTYKVTVKMAPGGGSPEYMLKGGKAAPELKLPAVYGDVNKTPLTCKVTPEGDQLTIAMKSNP